MGVGTLRVRVTTTAHSVHNIRHLMSVRNRHIMPKLIAFNEEARRGLERGMNTLADAVR